MTAPPIVPTTDLVAMAWLRGVPGLVPGAIATTLPTDTAGWATSGFVQVLAVGGSPNPHLPVRAPVVSLSCWACAPGSRKPPWGKANSLAEAIRAGTWGQVGRVVTLAVGGLRARVLDATVLAEPRRVTGDPAGYARYDLDLALPWTDAAGTRP